MGNTKVTRINEYGYCDYDSLADWEAGEQHDLINEDQKAAEISLQVE